MYVGDLLVAIATTLVVVVRSRAGHAAELMAYLQVAVRALPDLV